VVDGVTRVACVLVDAFAAAALERCEPALRAQPLAVVAGAPPATRVVEANARARAEGVGPGLSAAEAGVRCPALVRRPARAEAEAAARHALLEACLGVSPRLEDAGPGLVHVDLAGLRRLFGADADIARELRRRASAVGLPVRVGIAGSRAAATVAARLAQPVHVLAPGAERAALAPVPLATLPWPEALAATFARWGLETLGDLAALPREGVGTRLGAAGLAAHDRATGLDRAPFRPWTPPAYWEEAQGLDWELTTLPALAPVLERVLQRLCARLTAAHLAADALDLRLALASGGHHARAVALAAPLAEPAPIAALLTLEIEAHPPAAAIVGVALSAHVVARRAAPGGLWQPPAPAPRDLAAVLARLTTLVGGANVGAPAVLDSHRPDPSTLVPFDTAGVDEERHGSAGARRTSGDSGAISGSPISIRRLRPPRRVGVETRDGRPARVSDPAAGALGVVTCAGPWRASGDWWDVDVWARDEWDVVLADGTVWRLVHDRLAGDWHLDAVYD